MSLLLRGVRSMLTAACAVAALAFAFSAAAQSRIAADHAFSWSENAGWLNWRGNGDGANGVVVGEFFLEGAVWGENVGWIRVGDGTPTDGLAYSNAPDPVAPFAVDFGVNVAIDGALSGWAWGENVGWIRFDTSDALGTAGLHARVDLADGRLRGYAWGENIGWMNLDDDAHYVALECPGDCVAMDPCLTGTCVAGVGCAFEPTPGCGGECAVDGDLDASGSVSIIDVQCSILTTLASLEGSSMPACLAGGFSTADLDCDGQVQVNDILITIQLTLGVPLSLALDANGNQCVDACEL